MLSENYLFNWLYSRFLVRWREALGGGNEIYLLGQVLSLSPPVFDGLRIYGRANLMIWVKDRCDVMMSVSPCYLAILL